MRLREELNPTLRPNRPLSFHEALTLYSVYEAARERTKVALMLAGIFALALFAFSVMTAFDDAHQRQAILEANNRAAASNLRTLRLIDYLNKIK